MTPKLLILSLSLLMAGACREAAHEAAETPVVLEVESVGDIPPGTLTLPNRELSVKFAIIGDSGRGSAEQHAVAAQMAAYQKLFDYRFVLMAGDNIYEGPATPEDYRLKFEAPYQALLDAGVQFFAVLGNHDDPQQVHYPPFHMDGHRYYSFTPPVNLLARLQTRVRFFALDSTNLDGDQVRWLEQQLARSTEEWKIALMHYPLYSSGRYTLQARRQRFTLEGPFVDGGIDLAFSGHEHIYQRSHLQNGILYFITGGAGSLRAGDASPASSIARSFDRDYHFMLAEISDEGFFFQAVDRIGHTVDAGTLRRATPVTRTVPPAASTTTDTPARR